MALHVAIERLELDRASSSPGKQTVSMGVRVEAPITDHLRDYECNLDKYKVL